MRFHTFKKPAAFLALVSLVFAQPALAYEASRDESGSRFVPVIALDWSKPAPAPAIDALLSPHDSFFGSSPLSPATLETSAAGWDTDYWAQVRANEEAKSLAKAQKQELRKEAREALRLASHERQKALREARAQAREIARALALEKEAAVQKIAEALSKVKPEKEDKQKKKDPTAADYGFTVADNTEQIKQQAIQLDAVEANLKKQLADAEAQTAKNVTDISNAAKTFVSSLSWELGSAAALFMGVAAKEALMKNEATEFTTSNPYPFFVDANFKPAGPIMAGLESLASANLLGSLLSLSDFGDLFKTALDYKDILVRGANQGLPFYPGVSGFAQTRSQMLWTTGQLSTFSGQANYFRNKLSAVDFAKAFCLSCPEYDAAFSKALVETERRKVFPEDVKKAIQAMRSYVDLPGLNPLPGLIINTLANEQAKDHFKNALNYISSLRTAAGMGISLASDKFQTLVQEMAAHPFQTIYDGLMQGPGYFLKEIFKNTFKTVVSDLRDTILAGAAGADIDAFTHTMELSLPGNELIAALQKSSELLLDGIDPAAAAPSTESLTGKQARTYLLNGINNIAPEALDNAPEYMHRLDDYLTNRYGFTDTQLIGLYINPDIAENSDFSVKDLSAGLETILASAQYLKEARLLAATPETSKVTSQIKLDLEMGRILHDDTLNFIAYSGGGQRVLDAAERLRLLPIKYNALFYGAPIVPLPGIDLTTLLTQGVTSSVHIPNGIQNIKTIWGSNDLFNFARPEGGNFFDNLMKLSGYTGVIKPSTLLDGYYHYEEADKSRWDYHSVAKNKTYKTTYIDELAQTSSNYFESLTP